MDKLTPRMADLTRAIEDAASQHSAEMAKSARCKARAERLDSEIRQIENPAAEAARERVQAITKRRREIEGHLLRFRELDVYIHARQEAALTASKSVDRYRPEQDLASLQKLGSEIREQLKKWKFPLHSDLHFDAETDDLVIDGKQRKAFGKGARAVTHAAFTVGLMGYCMDAGTPHPGFVIIDSPLTPFKGVKDEEPDPNVTLDVHTAVLYSLATATGEGQAVIIENVPPPDSIRAHATIHEFGGPDGSGRKGFYPQS